MYEVAAGEKLLGNQFSRFMKYSGNSSMLNDSEYRFQNFLDDSTKNVTVVKLLRVENSTRTSNDSNSNVLYFYFQGMRWSQPLNDFLMSARLGPGDIMSVSASYVEQIPLGPIVPNHLFKEGALLCWRNETFVIMSAVRRKLANSADNRSRCVNRSVSDPWIQMISQEADLPDIFRDGTLLRQTGAQEVFLVRNGTRHSIPSLQKFLQLGRDFSEVKVLSWDDLNLVPLGDSL